MSASTLTGQPFTAFAANLPASIRGDIASMATRLAASSSSFGASLRTFLAAIPSPSESLFGPALQPRALSLYLENPPCAIRFRGWHGSAHRDVAPPGRRGSVPRGTENCPARPRTPPEACGRSAPHASLSGPSGPLAPATRPAACATVGPASEPVRQPGRSGNGTREAVPRWLERVLDPVPA